jgi:hypothetical protein
MRSYGGESAPAYTQGRTVNIGGENFLIAYVAEGKGGDYAGLMYNGRISPDAPEPEPITGEATLSLVLLGQRGFTSMTKVRPFNLAAELADYERYLDNYRSFVANRSSMNQQTPSQPADSLRTVAVALAMYAEDHGGALPPMDKPDAFRKALDDYVESADMLKDPETKEYYGINPSLSGKKVKQIENPSKTIVVYQAKPGKDGKRGVVFVDGTIRRLTETEWTELKAASKIP